MYTLKVYFHNKIEFLINYKHIQIKKILRIKRECIAVTFHFFLLLFPPLFFLIYRIDSY